MAERRVLTVYSRPGCHLCDEMIEALRVMQGRFHFSVTVIDIAGDPELEQRHGERIPVLMDGARELGHFRIDSAKVAEYLDRISG